MQPRDGSVSFNPSGSGEGSERDADDSARPEAIRDRQRRRRDAGRTPQDLAAILSQPDEAEEEDEGEAAPPAGPAPVRVFVLFRGMSWEDPQGGLRESDNIVGIYATEEAARRAAAALRREGGEGAECWYQPYPVQE